ncbi:MAG: hypothetical protein ACP5R1_00070 [Athalassotoga sp.]
MRRYFLAIFVFIIPVLTFAAVSFPYGSVMNFNPSYMIYNTQWSVSYETYFGEPQQMDFVIFQPFKNGFAGKLGFYTSGATSGIAYSVATKSGNLNFGSDFLISDYGTNVSLNFGAGMVEKILQNLDLSVRLPNVLTYTYGKSINVYPNFEVGLNLPYEYWSLGAFLSVNQFVSGGFWGSLSAFNIQALARIYGGYIPSTPSITQNVFDFNLQGSIGSMSFAYLYKYVWGTTKSQENGFRISAEW